MLDPPPPVRAELNLRQGCQQLRIDKHKRVDEERRPGSCRADINTGFPPNEEIFHVERGRYIHPLNPAHKVEGGKTSQVTDHSPAQGDHGAIAFQTGIQKILPKLLSRGQRLTRLAGWNDH